MESPSSMYYFAYGCNMDPGVMAGRLGKRSRRLLAWIKGYRLVFDVPYSRDPHIGFANIQRDPRETVYGVLYTQVTKKGFDELDHQEEFPDLYKRKLITVFTVEGPIKALVYIGNQHILNERAKPSEHYLTCLMHGKDLLPDSQISTLRHLTLKHPHI